MARRDERTLDLLSWSPPEIAPALAPERVQAGTLMHRVTRTLAEALRQSGRTHAETAEALSAYLDEEVGEDTISAYASQAKDKHNMPAYRMFALVAVLDDPSMLNTLLAETRWMVTDAKFAPLIRRELALEKRAELDRMVEAASAEWKAGQ